MGYPHLGRWKRSVWCARSETTVISTESLAQLSRGLGLQPNRKRDWNWTNRNFCLLLFTFPSFFVCGTESNEWESMAIGVERHHFGVNTIRRCLITEFLIETFDVLPIVRPRGRRYKGDSADNCCWTFPANYSPGDGSARPYCTASLSPFFYFFRTKPNQKKIALLTYLVALWSTCLELKSIDRCADTHNPIIIIAAKEDKTTLKATLLQM